MNIKTLILALVLIALLIIGGKCTYDHLGNRVRAEYSDSWWDCSQTEECTKVDSTCGRAGAINKKFEKEFEEIVRREGSISLCSKLSKESLESDQKAIPSCINGKCRLMPPPNSLESESK